MAAQPETFKNQLYAWLGRRRLLPVYRAYPNGTGQFICVLSVPGYAMETEGRAARKADAYEEAARKFVERLKIENKWVDDPTPPRPRISSSSQHRDAEPPLVQTNPKTDLNLYLQNVLKVSPAKYHSSGPHGDGRFRCRLEVTGLQNIVADGLSKVEAECACAREALAELRRREPPVAQSDGPRLSPPSSGAPALRRQWSTTRPDQDNPKSLLNEFLQRNGVELKYDSYRGADGQWHTSSRITLKGLGLQTEKTTFEKTATAPSKAESTKACAEKLILDLERLELLDRGRDVPSAEPDTPETFCQLNRMTVSQALEVPTSPLPAATGSAIQGNSAAPAVPSSSGTTNISYHGPVHMVHYHHPTVVGELAPPGAAVVPDALPAPPPHRATPASENVHGPPRPIPHHMRYLFESSELVTEQHILKASRKIGELRKTIGLSLGLDPPDVDNCVFKEDDPYEVNRKILRMWREKFSGAATLGRLCEVLWNCQAYEAVRDLHELRNM